MQSVTVLISEEQNGGGGGVWVPPDVFERKSTKFWVKVSSLDAVLKGNLSWTGSVSIEIFIRPPETDYKNLFLLRTVLHMLIKNTLRSGVHCQ